MDDPAHRLLPLTDLDADRLITSLRCSPLLFVHRDRPLADVAALADMLLRVAALAEDVPQIAELQLNPVVVSPTGIAPPEPQPSVWLPRLKASTKQAQSPFRR